MIGRIEIIEQGRGIVRPFSQAKSAGLEQRDQLIANSSQQIRAVGTEQAVVDVGLVLEDWSSERESLPFVDG